MIEKQYEMILELHGDWLDKAIEEVAKQPNAGTSMDTRDFAGRIRKLRDMPDGLQALVDHYFHEVTERRLDYLTSVDRTREIEPSCRPSGIFGWRVFRVIDVLDALAGL
jgi:hypothetical protein